ncbi:MAG: SUMF1/EgtB/PvdO family nonheme iron enzyme [bacterium]
MARPAPTTTPPGPRRPPGRLRHRHLPGHLRGMARFPCGSGAQRVEAAAARQPRLWASGPRLFGRHGAAALGPFRPRRPITGITLADAQAYARWRSQRDGLPYRLPSNAEWEKAMRGVDGRAWPWGDRPDPGRSPPSLQALADVDAFPDDVSVHGVGAATSGVFEWTLTRADEGRCFVRGHCPVFPTGGAPCVQRLSRDPHRPSPLLGFRLVIGPPPGRPSGPVPLHTSAPPPARSLPG